jgi:Lon protease-like protein
VDPGVKLWLVAGSRTALAGNLMIDQDFDLRGFSGATRLFPLANLVMFPHVVLPLHIFEPRYRQMTEHSLSTDRLITMIQINTPPRGQVWTEPVPIEAVGCLGRIIQHERLSDGRFNFLLLGLKRVRLLQEIKTDALYRMAEVEILEDIPPSQPEQLRREELVGLFRRRFAQFQERDTELDELLDKDIPLSVLADIMVHSLALPPSLKQYLLGETSVDLRVEKLCVALQESTADDLGSRSFPPPFSTN